MELKCFFLPVILNIQAFVEQLNALFKYFYPFTNKPGQNSLRQTRAFIIIISDNPGQNYLGHSARFCLIIRTTKYDVPPTPSQC